MVCSFRSAEHDTSDCYTLKKLNVQHGSNNKCFINLTISGQSEGSEQHSIVLQKCTDSVSNMSYLVCFPQ